MSYTVKKLPKFKLFKGHDTVMVTFKKGKYTWDQIYKAVDRYNKTAYEAGFRGKMMTSIKYPDKYRSGKPTEIGEPINIFSFAVYKGQKDKRQDPDYFEQFFIYVSKRKN